MHGLTLGARKKIMKYVQEQRPPLQAAIATVPPEPAPDEYEWQGGLPFDHCKHAARRSCL